LKNLISATQAATISDTDTATDTYMETKPSAAHAFELKDSNGEAVRNPDGSADVEAAPVANQRQVMQAQLTAPTRLPADVRSVATTSDAPPPATLGGASMAALNGGSSFGNVFSDQSNAKVSGPRTVTVSSGVASGMLIHKTQPIYPSIAKSARVQGTVVLQAKISRSGSVTDLQVVGGPPMLRQAAIDAVKTWQYKPYLLNNQPTEVNTTIEVHFTLGG
jgi:protein TonB